MRSARSRFDTEEASGQDSFLDIVANIVGILILLVMVVGVRAARRPAAEDAESQVEQAIASVEVAPEQPAPVEQPLAEPTPAELTPNIAQVEADLEAAAKAAEKRAATLEREAQEIALRAIQARKELAEQDQLRVSLATFVAETEQQLEEKRRQLAQDERADYDNRVAIAEAQRQLDDLARKQAAQLAVEANVETIENLPTPIAKTVHENEVYLMLTEGGVAVLPLEALRDQLQARLGDRPSLAGRNSLSFLVGPIGGFRLRFLVHRVRVPSPNGTRTTIRQLWELVPSDDLITEPVNLAIQDGSALMTALATHPPQETTITAITYADSFDEFRTLKKRLYELGYPVAGRPLEVGQPVIGSPQGRRSAAQ